MRRCMLVLGLWCSLSLAVAAPAVAERPLTTLTFDELSAQPVQGLSVNGVTFGFTIAGVASADAVYAGAGPGTTTWIQDPSLEGSAFGTLTLTFDQPTTVLEFGVARVCICTLPEGAAVELFRPGAERSFATLTTATSPLISFSEALFSYRGPAIQRAVITFPSPELADRFSLDNLRFQGKA